MRFSRKEGPSLRVRVNSTVSALPKRSAGNGRAVPRPRGTWFDVDLRMGAGRPRRKILRAPLELRPRRCGVHGSSSKKRPRGSGVVLPRDEDVLPDSGMVGLFEDPDGGTGPPRKGHAADLAGAAGPPKRLGFPERPGAQRRQGKAPVPTPGRAAPMGRTCRRRPARIVAPGNSRPRPTETESPARPERRCPCRRNTPGLYSWRCPGFLAVARARRQAAICSLSTTMCCSPRIRPTLRCPGRSGPGAPAMRRDLFPRRRSRSARKRESKISGTVRDGVVEKELPTVRK